MLNKETPHITIDNEDNTYYIFIKYLMIDETISSFSGLRCHQIFPTSSLSNKIKKVSIEFQPYEGTYVVKYKGNSLQVCLCRKEPKVTTQCRKIEYIKEVSIYGQTIQIVKQFVQYIFSLANQQNDQGLISIYENVSGYWRETKKKRARTLESVIMQQQFCEQIISDIRQFINSEQWYTSMGIPYKRSYLFYGPPGTGKSSLAQAIAGHIQLSICYLNFSDNITDYLLNNLLNSAPKRSIILIEDVDSVFCERKSVQKTGSLTFSGFLNAIDGVRSQQGRIIVMTTNFKERLDPALLRPGRTDQAYEIGLATKYQIQKMCFRFFQNERLAQSFALEISEGKFSMSMIQGFLVKYRKNPQIILEKVQELLMCDENVLIDQFLQEINCQQSLNHFKLEECHTLAQAKNLPKVELQKIASKLSPLLGGRLVEVIHLDRRNYIKSSEELEKYINASTSDEQLRRKLYYLSQQQNYKTIYQVKDKLNEISQNLGKSEEKSQ